VRYKNEDVFSRVVHVPVSNLNGHCLSRDKTRKVVVGANYGRPVLIDLKIITITNSAHRCTKNSRFIVNIRKWRSHASEPKGLHTKQGPAGVSRFDIYVI
jgi:hypothetical protein